MMAEPICRIEGFAIIPPEAEWSGDTARLSRLAYCYCAHHIPVAGILPNRRATVWWKAYGEPERWMIASRLAKYLYPNATPQAVYRQGHHGNLLISLERLTLHTKQPLPEDVL